MYDVTKIAQAIATVTGLDLVKELYKDLAQPGVKQVGKAIEAVLKVPNLALGIVTKWEGRQNIALEANLEAYRVEMAKVPEEKVVEVPPEVGVPIVEKLTYVRDSDLSRLYVSLLASASNSDSSDSAHPSFVHLIDGMSPDEGRFLKQLARRPRLPFVETRFVNNDNSHIVHQPFVVTADVAADLSAAGNLAAYINNLQRLGIITASSEVWMSDPTKYEVLENAVRNSGIVLSQGQKLVPQRGLIAVTAYGQLFLRACRVLERIEVTVPAV